MKNLNYAVLLGLCALFLASLPVQATELDPNTGEGSIELNRKIHCSRVDGEEVTYVWWGNAYARIPGERDRHLFQLLGMNVRKCGSIEDEARGKGYRMVSREIMLYLDPTSGEILREWENPWTGNTVNVIHVANDPVNGRPNYAKLADGSDNLFNARMVNGTYFLAFEIPLFYPNVLGGDYQQYVGGTYHSAEIFDFSGNADTLMDASTNIEFANVAWVRLAQWLPWMEMGDRVGIMYFNAVGKKLQSWDQLPTKMQDEIHSNYPAFTNAPSLDDSRPNETSWTYMKKIIDQRNSEQ
ncbi:MAG: DUF1838 domain-containing protein [Gammaproteobacteria bacterium]|nr:DUF1838 domain-containing protein [Gammaproteobacteria bacterium]